MDVRAVPYDMPITGYGTKNVNTLRLWKSEPIEEFDYDAFNSQRFTDAIVERERVADLAASSTRTTPPTRARYCAFASSTSSCPLQLQTMVDVYKREHGDDLTGFGKFNSVQLNDTHPVLAIPELMRLLLDDHGMSWDDAWAVIQQTFAYTNHTVLAEALEKWEVSIFQKLFPRVFEIVQEIDRRFREELAKAGHHPGKIDYMSPVHGGPVHMAWDRLLRGSLPHQRCSCAVHRNSQARDATRLVRDLA